MDNDFFLLIYRKFILLRTAYVSGKQGKYDMSLCDIFNNLDKDDYIEKKVDHGYDSVDNKIFKNKDLSLLSDNFIEFNALPEDSKLQGINSTFNNTKEANCKQINNYSKNTTNQNVSTLAELGQKYNQHSKIYRSKNNKIFNFNFSFRDIMKFLF